MERVAEEESIAEMADARRFNQVMGRGIVQQEYRRLAHDLVALGIPQEGRVLDIGTGPGFVAIEVARLLQGQRVSVIGMDLSRAMLAVAAENAQRARLGEMLSWREGDAKAIPFGDAEFDLVVSSGSLHHWEKPLAVFDEIARILKPNGHCVVRDSRRLQEWAPLLLAHIIGLTLPRDFRCHYWGSIRSSYTPEEVRATLERSRLRGWRVETDVMDLVVIR
jgi:ubiquinone/menaquinone biosynthesis C-methylase UbiE